MADTVNVKINQSVKGNRFSGKSKIIQKGRIRFILPANIIINLRARQNIQKAKEATNTEATQSLKVNGEEVKGDSNDK